MKYNITKPQSLKIPELGKGTECIKLLLSQASKDMYEPLVPKFFPILGAHMSGVEFQYPDLNWKEPAGMMANLVAESGGNKGKLSNIEKPLSRLPSPRRQLQRTGLRARCPLRPYRSFRMPRREVSSYLRKSVNQLIN